MMLTSILVLSLQTASFFIKTTIALLGLMGRWIEQASKSLSMTQPQLQPNLSLASTTSASSFLPAKTPPKMLIPPVDSPKAATDDRGAIKDSPPKSAKEKKTSPMLSECFYVVPAALALSCVTAWGTKEDRRKVGLAHERNTTLTMTLFYNLSKLLTPLTEEVQVIMAFDCGTRSIPIRTHIITLNELLAGQTVISIDETEIDQVLHHLAFMNGPALDNKGFIHHPAGILKLSIFHKARHLETLVEANESESLSSSSDSKSEGQAKEEERATAKEEEESVPEQEEPLLQSHIQRHPSRSKTSSAVISSSGGKLESIKEGEEEGNGSSSTIPAKQEPMEEAAPHIASPHHFTHHDEAGPALHTTLTERASPEPPSVVGAVYDDYDSKGSNESSSLAGGEDIVTLLHAIKGELKGRNSCLRLLANINILVLPFDAAQEVQRHFELMIISAKEPKKSLASHAAPQQAASSSAADFPADFFQTLREKRPRFSIVRTKHAPAQHLSHHGRGTGRWADGWEDEIGRNEGRTSADQVPQGFIASRAIPTVTYTDDNPIIDVDPTFDYEAFIAQEKAILEAKIEASRALPGLVFNKFDSIHARVFHRNIKSLEEDMKTLFLASSRILFEAESLGASSSVHGSKEEAGRSESASEEQRVAEKAAKIFGPDLMQFLSEHEMWALFHLVMEWHFHSGILVLQHHGFPCPPHITSSFIAQEFCSSQGLMDPSRLTDQGWEPKGISLGERATEEDMMINWRKPPAAPRRKPSVCHDSSSGSLVSDGSENVVDS